MPIPIFLETLRHCQGKDAADNAFVLGATRWEDGTPSDPTIWEDWLAAVHICRSNTPKKRN